MDLATAFSGKGEMGPGKESFWSPGMINGENGCGSRPDEALASGKGEDSAWIIKYFAGCHRLLATLEYEFSCVV